MAGQGDKASSHHSHYASTFDPDAADSENQSSRSNQPFQPKIGASASSPSINRHLSNQFAFPSSVPQLNLDVYPPATYSLPPAANPFNFASGFATPGASFDASKHHAMESLNAFQDAIHVSQNPAYGFYQITPKPSFSTQDEPATSSNTRPRRMRNSPPPPAITAPMVSPKTKKRRNYGDEESEDSKKLARLEKNREAARDCRRRKKDYIKEMERKLENLTAENATLKLELAKYKDRVKALESKASSSDSSHQETSRKGKGKEKEKPLTLEEQEAEVKRRSTSSSENDDLLKQYLRSDLNNSNSSS